jgi:hypothetical protein
MKHGTSHVARRGWPVAVAVAAIVLVASSSALAKTVVGTAKNDVLRGTAKADKLLGKGGNDKLTGLGGNDVLVGGAGNDTLVGGQGADKLQCGPGRDTVLADAADSVSPDCELVKGPVLPSVSVADASAPEGDSGTTTLSFPISLSKAVAWPVSVDFKTADGSATASSDYASASGTVTFAPGETSNTIDVSVKGDTAIESDETLTVGLSNPVNTQIAEGSATGTIKNDDKPKPRTGHYTGLTSQNRAISFDLSPDATTITNLEFEVDVQCQGVDYSQTNVPIDFGSSQIRLKPDFSFAVSGHDGDSNGTVDFSVSGYVTLGGSAAGTANVDFGVYTDIGTIHCITGAITWSAG